MCFYKPLKLHGLQRLNTEDSMHSNFMEESVEWYCASSLMLFAFTGKVGTMEGVNAKSVRLTSVDKPTRQAPSTGKRKI